MNNEQEFNSQALELYKLHIEKNPVYKEYVSLVDESGVFPREPQHYSQIPCLPIEFFKTKKVFLDGFVDVDFFESSGTTAMNRKSGADGDEDENGSSPSETSRHYIADFSIYRESLLKTFTCFLGSPKSFAIVALLPHYLEREHSSLVYMVKTLIEESGHPANGFFLYNHQELYDTLVRLESEGQKTLLIGVSFALLDFADFLQNRKLQHTLIMETGGMKGRKKEITRSQLHTLLRTAFGVKHIYSEYGMAELFSQAYLLEDGKFHCPPQMKVMLRSPYDPFENITEFGKTGGINVIDLANIHSCPFIQTQDLGRLYSDGSFDVIGRFDNSQIRGCNLLYLPNE
ncbi:MAG: acyltransferase [Bacteroidales bacterium]|nr:acyltransferase [Bacteroidales bacterium]